jgi:hypothetical protein
MRIEIKYESSEGGHLIDLDLNDLEPLRKTTEDIVIQKTDPIKSLHIEGKSEELEVLAEALLSRAKALRR